jgi:hypothetical protein
MLREEIEQHLGKIRPSHDNTGFDYYPCEVTLVDGKRIDRVYVAPISKWVGHWGAKYDENSPSQIPVSRVKSIRESPRRLPVALANKIYRQGESGMGYTLFGLILKDGCTIPCSVGDAVDFIKLPEGISLSDIKDVIPHWGRDIWGKTSLRGERVSFKWCLF